MAELNHEVNILKKEIKKLKEEIPELKNEIAKISKKPNFDLTSSSDEEKCETSKVNCPDSDSSLDKLILDQGNSLKILKGITIQKWYVNITIIVNKTFMVELHALVDTGADLNCIQEGLIPTTYYEKTSERLSSTNGSQMNIKYKLPKVHICQDGVCFKTSFVLIRNMTYIIILGLPFIYLLYPFTTTTKGLISHHLSQNVTFSFLTEPKERNLKLIKD